MHLSWAWLQRQQGTDSLRSEFRAKCAALVDMKRYRFILRYDTDLKMCMGKTSWKINCSHLPSNAFQLACVKASQRGSAVCLQRGPWENESELTYLFQRDKSICAAPLCGRTLFQTRAFHLAQDPFFPNKLSWTNRTAIWSRSWLGM